MRNSALLFTWSANGSGAREPDTADVDGEWTALAAPALRPELFTVPNCFADLRHDRDFDDVEAAGGGWLEGLTGLASAALRRLVYAAAIVAVSTTILAANFRPILATFDAFQTAGGALAAAVRRVTGRAERLVHEEASAVTTARDGLDCLAGTGPCPNGEPSPFK